MAGQMPAESGVESFRQSQGVEQLGHEFDVFLVVWEFSTLVSIGGGFALHSHQHHVPLQLCLAGLFISAMLIEVRWNLSVLSVRVSASQNPQEAGPAARLGSAGESTQALGGVGILLKPKAALAAASMGSKKPPGILHTKGRRIGACEVKVTATKTEGLSLSTWAHKVWGKNWHGPLIHTHVYTHTAYHKHPLHTLLHAHAHTPYHTHKLISLIYWLFLLLFSSSWGTHISEFASSIVKWGSDSSAGFECWVTWNVFFLFMCTLPHSICVLLALV